MPESMTQLWSQLQGMPPARRATLAITAVGSLLFFLWLGWGTTRGDHAVLYLSLIHI